MSFSPATTIGSTVVVVQTDAATRSQMLEQAHFLAFVLRQINPGIKQIRLLSPGLREIRITELDVESPCLLSRG